jgi:uncharacterized membrane protein
MRVRWVFLPLAIAVIAWVVPLIVGGSGGTAGGAGRGGGAPFWVFVAYVVAGLSLLAFIVLLCVWAATRRRRP